MQKALEQAILQETQYNDNKDIKHKHKQKKGTKTRTFTKTITSGDIFSARTLESRFVLSHYDQRTVRPNAVISVHRNLLRRGRSPFPKKQNKKYRQRNQRKINIKNKKTQKLLRYQKRKPFYLLQENTKHSNSGWLNTHLWHSKRCKMQTLWRYKLAIRNLQHAAKSFRSTITQLTTCCTLHDASYWNIIALRGAQSKIIDLMLPYIAPFQRGTESFTHKQTLCGYKECEIYIYKNGCYPFGFLCTVKCSWNAVEINLNDNDDRVCWIWCHASVYKALFKLLAQVVKGSDTNIEIRNESRQFVRYELRGPMSSFVLQSASNCAIPVLMEEKSRQYVGDGTIMCSKLICDPKHYSVSQPFITNKKTKNRCNTLSFQLKNDFVSMYRPCQHPLVLINEYKANNCIMNHNFHTYMQQKEDIEMEYKHQQDSNTKKRKKIRNPLFELPFMMIARRFYDTDNERAPAHKIVGYDIIIPIHCNTLASFKLEEPPLLFTSIARFWWNNLYFAGGRVIGYEQKLFMRLEIKTKQLLFPIDYMDCSASVHYWLKYYKYERIKSHFKKPTSKRINPYPLYPFGFWPNLLLLFQDKDSIKDMQLSDSVLHTNVLKIEKCDIDNDDMYKESKYLLNYTLWGFKNDCDLMNNIRLDLQCDIIESFDGDWNENKHCKYFIVRDGNILCNVKQSISCTPKPDFVNLCNWNESMLHAALVFVNITMCQKGVPTVGNPMFLNDAVFGYVVHGGYSSISGCGVGIGIVKLDILLSSGNDYKITISPFCNYPKQLYACVIDVM